MKLKQWLQWSFIKEGFGYYFWNFHWIILMDLLALLCSLPVITIGPSMMALCAVTRKIAEGDKVGFGDFIMEFKNNIKSGLFYTVYIVAIAASLYSNLLILGGVVIPGYSYVAYIGIAFLILLVFFTLFYPFAGFTEKKPVKILTNSVVYASAHGLDTVFVISLGVILWFILSLSSVFQFLMFIPTLMYMTNRIIIGNNIAIDNKIEADDAKKAKKPREG